MRSNTIALAAVALAVAALFLSLFPRSPAPAPVAAAPEVTLSDLEAVQDTLAELRADVIALEYVPMPTVQAPAASQDTSATDDLDARLSELTHRVDDLEGTVDDLCVQVRNAASSGGNGLPAPAPVPVPGRGC